MRESPVRNRSIVATLLAAVLAMGMPLAARAQDDLLARIQALEHDGDSRPRQAAQALEALAPRTAPFSPERLELLTLRGLLLAQASEPEAADRVAQALDDWARARRAADAAA